MLKLGRPHLPTAALFTAIALGLAATVQAQDPPPQNIVVILADDVDWADLPFFSEPVVWSDQNQPVPDPDDPPIGDAYPDQARVNEIKEAFYRRPDLNRTAARMMANSDGSLGRIRSEEPPVSEEPLVVPVDLDKAGGETAAGFRYAHNAAHPSRDVLSGFGGLGRLAREGVIMPRFYSNSAQCAPARTAFITGRHQQRSGVNRNGDYLDGESSVTFAELLKQGCATGNSHACYHTGFFGKWNPSGDNNRPWRQGFDEFIGFESAARPYFSRRAATCSPLLDATSDPARPSPVLVCQGNFHDYPCATNADCPSGTSPSCAPYEAECKRMVCDASHGYCFNPNAAHVCTADSDCCPGPPGTTCLNACRAAGRYIGKKNWTTCDHRLAGSNLDCCTIKRSSKVAENPQEFGFRSRKIVRDPYEIPNVVANVGFSVTGSRSGDGCNDDGPYNLDGRDLYPYQSSYEACLYSDRLMRDFARNFLIRRLYDDDPSDRFLLVLAPKGVHLAVDAPPRTEDHYTTIDKLNPNRPGDNSKEYWAVLEELDAVVGTILNLVDGMCDETSPEDLLGTPCDPGDSAACGGQPGRCVSHRDDTLVLFTNDNGSPGEGWGQPDLRGSKQSTLEGGTRVGLLARGPGLEIGHLRGQTSGGRANATSTSVGGLIDIFATVAEAAGYELDTAGTAQITTCRGTDDFCASNADCTGQCQGDPLRCSDGAVCATNADCGRCDAYAIDGRSLISVLNGTGEAVSIGTIQDQGRRSFGYMNYPASGEPSNAVTARDGYFQPCDTNDDGAVSVSEATDCASASHVCSYESTFTRSGAVKQYTRAHHGSSCMACKPGISDCGAERCEVVGKMCHSAMASDSPCRSLANTGSDVWQADDPLQGCGVKDAQRCRGNADCPDGQLCYGDVAVECDTCTAASWKARGNDDVANTTELFDLASNPEEDPKQYESDPQAQDYYGGDGHLNCATHALGEPWQQARIQRTRCELGSRLASWQSCVSDPSKLGQGCETSAPQCD